MTESSAPPRVVVLLALYNGMPYLPEQIESILAQEGVSARIIVSDDGSTDDALGWLRMRAEAGAPIELLPAVAPTGSAAGNFRRLIADAMVEEDELVAFADQDDVWHLDKLRRHAAIIAEGADGVSSSITAWYPDGSRALIRKDWPQREWDYLAEGPGPGCSQLLSPEGFALVRRVVVEVPEATETDFHDWLTYVALRAAGRRWTIDGVPSLDYRQHDENVIGANRGTAAARERLRLIRARWHREQAAINTSIAIAVSERLEPGSGAADADRLREILALLRSTGARERVALARLASRLRRRPRDRIALRALILGGVW